MPSHRTATLPEGIDGHKHVKITNWDYDRAGEAYQIDCECGVWSSGSCWDWPIEAFRQHIASVNKSSELALISDSDLADVLDKLAQEARGWLTRGIEPMKEAASRLRGGIQEVPNE